MPARPRVAQTGGAGHASPVHLPDRHLPAGVLPQNVGVPVAIKVTGCDMHPLNKPEGFIGAAQTKFDVDGRFTDEVDRGLIRDLLVALKQWTRRIGRK